VRLQPQNAINAHGRMFARMGEVDSNVLLRISVPLAFYSSSNMVPIQDQIYQQLVASFCKIS
jgi:hypothetical protein